MNNPGPSMNGTFNGVQLRRITSRHDTTDPTGTTLISFRVLDVIPALEEKLRLNEPALLILSDAIIEGRIVHYSANIQSGYEITIESKAQANLLDNRSSSA